jgi:hypothetical protein
MVVDSVVDIQQLSRLSAVAISRKGVMILRNHRAEFASTRDHDHGRLLVILVETPGSARSASLMNERAPA